MEIITDGVFGAFLNLRRGDKILVNPIKLLGGLLDIIVLWAASKNCQTLLDCA